MNKNCTLVIKTCYYVTCESTATSIYHQVVLNV